MSGCVCMNGCANATYHHNVVDERSQSHWYHWDIREEAGGCEISKIRALARTTVRPPRDLTAEMLWLQ